MLAQLIVSLIIIESLTEAKIKMLQKRVPNAEYFISIKNLLEIGMYG